MAKLSELKSLVARAKLSTARPAARVDRVAGSEPRDSADIDLNEAFSDVTRLRPENRAPIERVRPSSAASKRLADEADALAASRYGVHPSPLAWEAGQEHDAEQTFLRRGLAHDVLVRLRRGHWKIQGEIDLHRLTRDQAREALADFLSDARLRGWRCVRIIHGKGLSSPNREPILKGKVRRWLAQRDEVLAYCETPPHSGGSGAVLVLLASPSA